MPPTDPSGYYAALGVVPSATSDQIKRAFKAKARATHPDRNPAPDATQQFQFINEAYRVLGDAQTRAEYDAHAYEAPEEKAASAPPTVDPAICSVCGRASAQPRYAIYQDVVSAIFVTWRKVHQGIFLCGLRCKGCISCFLEDLAVGLVGIPLGPRLLDSVNRLEYARRTATLP